MKKYIIRDAVPADISFIYSSWLDCYKHDSYLGKTTTNTIFFENYREIIDNILGREDSSVLVACSVEDETTIVGYSVTESDSILHFAYVKEAFRELGIATDLLTEAISYSVGGSTVDYTHRTFSADKLLRSRPNLRHNPFVLFTK